MRMRGTTFLLPLQGAENGALCAERPRTIVHPSWRMGDGGESFGCGTQGGGRLTGLVSHARDYRYVASTRLWKRVDREGRFQIPDFKISNGKTGERRAVWSMIEFSCRDIPVGGSPTGTAPIEYSGSKEL